MKLKVIHRNGAISPPFYYGYSYTKWETMDMESVWHIIPINYFIRWHRWVWFKWNKLRGRLDCIDKYVIAENQRRCEMCSHRAFYNEIVDAARKETALKCKQKEGEDEL